VSAFDDPASKWTCAQNATLATGASGATAAEAIARNSRHCCVGDLGFGDLVVVCLTMGVLRRSDNVA
jgi:hypothetical protein